MTIRNNCEWLFQGSLLAVARVNKVGEIWLTMTGGKDPFDPRKIGDTWLWESTEERFLSQWVFVKEIEPEVGEGTDDREPLIETWLIVCRFADGVDYHNGFFTSKEEAQLAYDEEPYDIVTGERVELLDIVRVPYYG
jgi:hypothetical protein